MFTGIVEQIGTVKSIRKIGGAARIAVELSETMSDLKIDDSIALNGTCQTVVKIESNVFEADAVEETLKKTTLGSFKTGQKINLERALLPTTRLGGHIVQGHVDCVGKISGMRELSSSLILTIKYPYEFAKYAVRHGSICVDGASLTIASLQGDEFSLSLIPHTLANTIIKNYRIGGEVNLEFDVLGKYIERLMQFGINSAPTDSPKSILEGYIDQPM
jgi:riboflavin synthase